MKPKFPLKRVITPFRSRKPVMPAKRRNKDDLWVPTTKSPKEIGSLLFGVELGLSFLQI
jgi:hypothetical protein